MKHELLSSKITFAVLLLSTVDGFVNENYARAIRLCKIALAGKPDIILLDKKSHQTESGLYAIKIQKYLDLQADSIS